MFLEGPSALSDLELLAILVGTGSRHAGVFQVAAAILERFGDLRLLQEAEPREVLRQSGMGMAKVARIFAALEMGRRSAGRPWQPGTPFRSARQVYEHLHQRLRLEKRERFLALFLDARHRLINEQEISRGSLVASIVHPREVFRPAIRLAAAAVIGVHNHPSGDPGHSGDDVLITRRLHEVGELIGITLLDHIIVADGGYCSFAEQGISPFTARRPGGVPAAVDTPRGGC